MIKSFDEIDNLASKGKPVRMAVLAADEREVLLTVKIAQERGYVYPSLIGNVELIIKASDEIGFDISSADLVEESDHQGISDHGIDMLFNDDVDIAIKGDIPTSFIYRSIIKHEKSLGGKRNISVNTIWDIPDVDHLTNITDTGVNINPDSKAKKAIMMNAVETMRLFGYKRPRVAILSAYNGINSMLDSFSDAREIQAETSKGHVSSLELMEETSIAEILLGENDYLEDINTDLNRVPHVMIVPHLDAGNIFSKLDFMLNVTRRSFVMSSRGPVIIPSRSDTHEYTVGEVALGVVVSRLLNRS